MSRNVAIIGAGCAGLSAARVLVQCPEYQVTIFEARARIGGRILTDEKASVDLGASYIHGIGTADQPNSFMDIVRSAKARHSHKEAPWSMFDQDGKAIPVDESIKVEERFWTIFDEALAHSKANSGDIPSSTSLYDYMEDAMKRDDALLRQRCLQYAQMWGMFVGTEIRKQSLKFLYFEDSAPGETTFVTSTYSSILQTLAEPVKSLVQLNKEVVNIVNIPSGVQLVFSDGDKQTFDAVIITIPLGCLQRKTIAFEPSLPPRFSSAISSIGYGNLEKAFIRFPRAWWPLEDGRACHAFLEPQYAPTNETKQMIEFLSYAHLQEDAQPTLLFFVYGPVSSWLASGPSDAQLIEYFKPYFSRMPGYEEGNPDCTPDLVGHSAWTEDKFSGYGSYTNFQIGQDHLDGDIATIRDGLPERKIWFAGEHAPPDSFGAGTVNGAYHSGEAVARRLREAMGDGE